MNTPRLRLGEAYSVLVLRTDEQTSIQAIQIKRIADLEIPDLASDDKNIVNQWPKYDFESRLTLTEGEFPAGGMWPMELKFRFSKRGNYLVRVSVPVGLENGTRRFTQILVVSNWVPVVLN